MTYFSKQVSIRSVFCPKLSILQIFLFKRLKTFIMGHYQVIIFKNPFFLVLSQKHDAIFWLHFPNIGVKTMLHTENQPPRCLGSILKVWVAVCVMYKLNIVKCFCPRLPLDFWASLSTTTKKSVKTMFSFASTEGARTKKVSENNGQLHSAWTNSFHLVERPDLV